MAKRIKFVPPNILCAALLGCLAPDNVFAQEPAAEKVPAAQSVAQVEKGLDDSANTPAESVGNDAQQTELLLKMAGRLEKLEETVVRLKEENAAESERRQSEEEMALLLDEEALHEPETEIFRLYGFMDMGVQRSWVDERATVAALFNTNATTFAVGNIDLYFDFNPDDDWRALAEIRFTGAPHGRIKEFGGITGKEFERVSTQQYDPHGTALNAPMWGGSTVIERAWVEWKKYQAFQLRTGSFFTPWGIWNVDHGSPTLISTAMPQFIQQLYFPVRQTGVQALGSFFHGKHEYAYRAWLSNGRNELSNLDFTDDKAFGARTFVRRETGTVRYQAGASFHHGRVADKVVNITSAPPITEDILFDSKETWAYTENIIGADLSFDIYDTRIRAEGTAQLRQYEEGKRPSVGLGAEPGALRADSWRYSGYLLIAQQLPWWGLEPYLYGEVVQQEWELPDGLVMLSPGLNVRFTPAATLKLQVTAAKFFNWKQESHSEKGLNDVTSALARIVLAF